VYLLAAPLIAGKDLAKMTPQTRALLTNREVVAADQDSLRVQGYRVAQEANLEVWMKPLADGSKAVGLFNRGWGAMPVTVNFRDIGLGDSATIRDLWYRTSLGAFKQEYTATVPQHGVVMINVKSGVK
jgi:alpha-galactosidase